MSTDVDSVTVMVPKVITDAMIISCTIAYPAAGETIWTSATYALDVERVYGHWIYVCVQAHTARTVTPDLDPNYWEPKQPCARWAALDGTIDTKSLVTTPCTYVIQPGFFNNITFYGLVGTHINVSITDSPGGSVFYTYDSALEDPPFDIYDWAFGDIRPQKRLILSSILPYPTAQATISITAAAGVTVGAGLIAFGDLRMVVSSQGTQGAASRGATAKPVSYAQIDTDKWGNTAIEAGPSATGLSFKIVMDIDDADYAYGIAEEMNGVPASWACTTAEKYTGLRAYGLASSTIAYDEPDVGFATITTDVKGLI